MIQSAAWSSTPELKQKLFKKNYPAEIGELISEKRKLRRRWHQTRAPQDKTKLNKINKQLTNLLKENKNETVNKYLRELTYNKDTNYSLWSVTKNLKRPIQHNPPVKTTDGNWAKTNMEKATCFSDYLEKVFQPYDNTLSETFHMRNIVKRCHLQSQKKY